MRYLLLIPLFYATILSAQKTGLAFDHNALLVNDLMVSSVFYMEILGLEEIENKTQKAHIRWFSLGNGKELHLSENKNHKVLDVKGVHFAMKANDLDVFIAHLQANKIPFSNWHGQKNITNTRPDNVRQIYIQDPNGYWIEINGK